MGREGVFEGSDEGGTEVAWCTELAGSAEASSVPRHPVWRHEAGDGRVYRLHSGVTRRARCGRGGVG